MENRKAFTMIELIIIIVIIGILAAAITPKLAEVQDNASDSTSFETERDKAIQKHSGNSGDSTTENW